MYEQFTDRAKRVMHFANDEATRFKHEYVGTVHVLLGLIKERRGVAARVIQNLGVNLQAIQVAIERVIPVGMDDVQQSEHRQTPRTERALEQSVQEASSLKHTYIGTEHILLGLLHDKECFAGQVLGNFGLVLENVRAEVVNLVGIGRDE